MRRADRTRSTALLATLVALTLQPHVPPAAAAEPTVDGRLLFERGLGRDGRTVSASVGTSGVTLSGAQVACANCHGTDALGGREGGSIAPDVRWYTLTKATGALRVGRDIRAPYSTDTFRRALLAGIGPDGTPLDPAMPKFDLADDEIVALRSHLESGIGSPSSARSRIVTLQRVRDGSPPLAEDALAELQLCLGTARDARGRPHRLEVIRYRDPDDAVASLERAVQSGSIAAVVLPNVAGWEHRFAVEMDARDIDVIAPLSLAGIAMRGGNAISVTRTLEEQVAMLVEALPDSAVLTALVDPAAGEEGVELATRATDAARAVLGEGRIEVVADPAVAARADHLLVTAPLATLEFPPRPTRRAIAQAVFVPAPFFDPVAATRLEDASGVAVTSIAVVPPPAAGGQPAARVWGRAACSAAIRSLGESAGDPQSTRETAEALERIAPVLIRRSPAAGNRHLERSSPHDTSEEEQT